MKRFALVAVAAVIAMSGWIVVGIADDIDPLKTPSSAKEPTKAVDVKNRKFGFEFTGLSNMQVHTSSDGNSVLARQIYVTVPVELPHPSATTWKLTNIPEHPEAILYLRFTVHSSHPYTKGLPPQGAIKIDISKENIDQAATNHPVTKVLYLPHSSDQKLAASELETLVSTRLDAGLDASTEAKRRGTILAQVTVSNKASNNFRPFEGSVLISGTRINSDTKTYVQLEPDEQELKKAMKILRLNTRKFQKYTEQLNSQSRKALESGQEVLAKKLRLLANQLSHTVAERKQQAQVEIEKLKNDKDVDEATRRELELMLRNFEREADELEWENKKHETEQHRRARERLMNRYQQLLKEEELERRKQPLEIRKRLRERVRRMVGERKHHASPEEREMAQRIEHLRRAAENLHAAGQHEPAEDIERQVRQMQRELEEHRHRLHEHGEHHHHHAPHQEVHKMLHDLRRDVKELRNEVREMHRLWEKQLKNKAVDEASTSDSVR